MKKFLRKIKVISGLLIILIVIMAIGCGKPITETEASPIEDSEELTPTQEETTVTPEASTETPIETSEEEISEEETTEEETSEETPEPEKYFTYKAKYLEEYPRALLITDESYPGDLRVTLADDLPKSFFEKRDCGTSSECFNQVIEGILNSLESKEVILRNTQKKGVLEFCRVDTTKPVEIVFKFVRTEDQERGPFSIKVLYEEGGFPYSYIYISYAFVQRQDKSLRFIIYQSPQSLEDELNLPRGRYLVSDSLYWMALTLKFHPEILGWDELDPLKIIEWGTPEEEKNFYRKFSQSLEEQEDPNQPGLGILMLKGERDN